MHAPGPARIGVRLSALAYLRACHFGPLDKCLHPSRGSGVDFIFHPRLFETVIPRIQKFYEMLIILRGSPRLLITLKELNEF
jgi:hypothetical protein